MKLRSLLAALALGVLPATAVHALGVAITVAPPPIPVYEQPLCPVEGYLWTPGYYEYDYDIASYYWVEGVWVPPPRVGLLWTPGYWGYLDNVYTFHTGFWGPRVGFYGGINYGYGYGGYGYYGGRWDRNVFRYNTAVTRVNANNIRNTYVDNNFRNRAENRASFNGRGGIVASASRDERRAARAERLQATAVQRGARDQARAAHNPGGPRNAVNREVARNAAANNPGRTRDAARREERRAAHNAQMTANADRRAARRTADRGAGINRSRHGLEGNPGRVNRQRAFNPGGGGGGRGQGRQIARAQQGGGGHGGGHGGGRGEGRGKGRRH